MPFALLRYGARTGMTGFLRSQFATLKRKKIYSMKEIIPIDTKRGKIFKITICDLRKY